MEGAGPVWKAKLHNLGMGRRIHLGVKCKGWPDWGQTWALLRYLGATAMLLAAKLGDLAGKLGYREVMLKLSWAMLCDAEAMC